MARDDKEQLILDAARKVFVEKGPIQARMKDIADEADITPSLLHYYFRKRDHLYDAVFEEEMKRLIPSQNEILTSDASLEEKLEGFIQRILDFHSENPHHAAFIAFEAHYNDEHLDRLHETFSMLKLEPLQKELDRRADEAGTEPMDVRHLMTNIFSLCLMPFIARPILKSIFEMEDDAYQDFIEARKTLVPQFVKQALRGCESAA